MIEPAFDDAFEARTIHASHAGRTTEDSNARQRGRHSRSTFTRFIAAASVALFSIPAGAQTSSPSATPISVYHLDPWLDGTVLGVSALAIVGGYLGGPSLVHPSCPCAPESVNALDRHVIGNESVIARPVSDITVAVSIGAPLVLDLIDVGAHQPFVEDAVVFGESIAVSEALATVTKFVVQRPRPSTYAGRSDRSADDYVSFYSSHTTKVFAALAATAMTLDLRHGQRYWPWAITAVVGTSVAAERVAAGRHFYSDVLVGALTGLAAGIVVPVLHERRTQAGSGSSSLSLSAMPILSSAPLVGVSGTF